MSETYADLRRDIARIAGENERRFGTPSAKALKIAAISKDLDELLATRDVAAREPKRQREQKVLCAISAVLIGALILGMGALAWGWLTDLSERDQLARATDQRHLDSMLDEREQVVREQYHGKN